MGKKQHGFLARLFGLSKGRRRRDTPKRSPRRGSVLTIERLETRQLLSAAPISLAVTSNPAYAGQPLSALVTLPGDAAGTVNLQDNGTAIGSTSLSGGAYALQLNSGSNNSGGFMAISSTEELNMSGRSLTIAIWVKPCTAYGGEELCVEHGVFWQDTGVYQLTTVGSNTARFTFPEMHLNDGLLDASVNLADGNWHFLVATFTTPDGDTPGTADLYDNGVLMASKSVSEPISDDGGKPLPTYVGCRGNQNLYFAGGIGEVLIYNEVLTAGDVDSLYENAGHDGDIARSISGLVAGYQFGANLQPDDTVDDISGNGNTGYLSASGVGSGPFIQNVAYTVAGGLTAGTHTLATAFSTNSSSYDDSTSAPATETVTPVVSLSSSAAVATVGQSVTITAQAPAGATGTVRLMDGTATLASDLPLQPAGNTETLQLDGNSAYVALPGGLKFTSGDFTISEWFDPVDMGTGSFQFLFMRGFAWGDQQGDIGFHSNSYTGNLQFEALESGGQSLFGWDIPESTLHSAVPGGWDQVCTRSTGRTRQRVTMPTLISSMQCTGVKRQ